MKLNNKRTILVGLAFLSICAFWQMYDSIVPLILTKTFHMNETFSGAIMAADNILALFLLPFFGSVSDKSHSKLGKRMPFILFGTGCAIILMNILPLLDNSYAAQPSGFKTASFVIVLGLLLVAMGTYRAPAVALMPDVTPKPLRSRANAIIDARRIMRDIKYHIFEVPYFKEGDAIVEINEEDYSIYYGASEVLEGDRYKTMGIYRYN